MVLEASRVICRRWRNRSAMRDQTSARQTGDAGQFPNRNGLGASHHMLVAQGHRIDLCVKLPGGEIEHLPAQISGRGQTGVAYRERRSTALRTIVERRGLG